MDEIGFRKYLRGFGKKEHVVDSLLRQAKQYEDYLSSHGQDLESAGESELQAYAAQFKPVEIKTRLRGVSLYYRFAGKASLAAAAQALREKETARTRKTFALKDFRGVDPIHADRLAAHGIRDVAKMLEAGQTHGLRRRLVAQTGLSPEIILELVKLSDLSRLGAVKQVRARLYLDAGLDTPEKIAAWEPGELRRYLAEFIKKTGFEGITPLPKELENLIRSARELPRIVEY